MARAFNIRFIAGLAMLLSCGSRHHPQVLIGGQHFNVNSGGGVVPFNIDVDPYSVDEDAQKCCPSESEDEERTAVAVADSECCPGEVRLGRVCLSGRYPTGSAAEILDVVGVYGTE